MLKPLTKQELEYLIACVDRDRRQLSSTSVVRAKLVQMQATAVDITEEPPYTQTATPHVWRVTATGKFVFCDETQNFDTTEYETEAGAGAALHMYCELWL